MSEKILTLSQDALTSGRARGKHDLRGGVWDTAQGMNPGINDDTYRGLVAMTASPTNLTGSVVEDTPIAYCIDRRNSTNNLYIMGDAGHFYNVDVNLTVTDLRDGANVIPSTTSNGMFLFQPRAATVSTLFYMRNSRIGSWDISGTYPTGWNDTLVTITDSKIHPVHRLFDTVYWGNKSTIGKTYDDGSATPAHDTNVLDFDGREVVTALGDDGRYLIAATAQVTQDSYNTFHSVRLVWWATNSANGSSWEWETLLPNETAVTKIIGTPLGVLAYTERACYQIAIGVRPKLVYTFDSDESVLFDPLNYSFSDSAQPFSDGAIVGKKGTVFARPFPNAESPAIYNPIHGHTGNISLVVPDFKKDTLFFGTDSDRLYSINLAGAGADSNETWTTRFFDLGAEYHLDRIDVSMPNAIGGSDAMSISVLGNGTSRALHTVNEANNAENEYYLRMHFADKGTLLTDRVRFSFQLTGGLPSFSRIVLYGTKAE